MDQLERVQTIAHSEVRKQFPFFAFHARRLSYEVADCKTFATDGNRVVINPEFAETLDDDGVLWVLVHEYLHVVGKHHLRQPEEVNGLKVTHFAWNVACDIAINQLIEDVPGFHPGALLPGKCGTPEVYHQSAEYYLPHVLLWLKE